VAFADVELPRPITVPPQGSRVVRVCALARGDRVDVVVRSDETAFDADHFRATCELERAAPPAPGPAAVEGEELEASDELYRRLLFHGARFQRVRGYRELRARRCVALVDVADDARWFGAYLPQDLLLGDVGARDAYIHGAQACIPHRRVLPLSIERVELLGRPSTTATVTAVERWATEDTLVYDLSVRDESGEVCETWQGLRLRAVEPLEPPRVWAPTTFVPYVERRIAELIPGTSVLVALTGNGERERPDRTEAALSRALGRQVRVFHRPDGKPDVGPEAAVSVAHDTIYTLAVSGEEPLACDIEVAEPRSGDAWRGLLGEDRFRLAERVATEAHEELELAGTRLWTAAECLRKAGRSFADPLVLDEVAPDGWTILRAGGLRIATCAAQLRDVDAPLVVGVLTGGGDGEKGNGRR
jgi:enediyne polyketide synthase